MNKREAAIISAYTGILCGEFSDMHEYIEEIMGRPVFTHEMGGAVNEQIKTKSKADFLAVSESITDE